MKLRNNKKGFTIVELVIVIAVIGILTAILVPVFINLTNKANEASDQSLVKNLNTVLAMKEQEVGFQKCETPSDMFDLLDAEGYNGEVLIKKQKSGKKIIYNLAKNRFLFEENKAGDDKSEDLWEFKSSVDFDTTNQYSIYLNEDYGVAGPVTATAGLDVGKNDEITKITYDRHDATSGRNTIIRTNGGDLIINAPKDTVKHFELANLVDVIAVDGDNSYHEYGKAGMAKIANGRFVITESAQLDEIRAVATNDAFNNIKLAVVGEAELPKITRDPLSIENTTEEGTHNQLVLEVQALNESGQKKEDSQFVWISVVVEGGVTTKTTEVASSATVLDDTTKIPEEQQTPAAAEAKSAVAVTKVSTFAELKAAVEAHKEYIVFANDIAVPSDSVNKLAGLININSSITIDGDSHSYTGYGLRGSSARTSFSINHIGNGLTPSASPIDVAFKNINITNSYAGGRPIETRGNLNSLTISNTKVECTANGDNQALTIGGRQASTAKVDIKDGSYLSSGNGNGYCVITFNPVDMNIDDSTIEGWACLYLKGAYSSEGSHGSRINLNNAILNSINHYSGSTDNFGCVSMEDDDIVININSSKLLALESGAATQSIFNFSTLRNDSPDVRDLTNRQYDSTNKGYVVKDCLININGESTSTFGKFILNKRAPNQNDTLVLKGGTFVNSKDELEEYVAEGYEVVVVDPTTQRVVKTA